MGEEKPKPIGGVWPTIKPFVNGRASGMLATCVIQPIDMIKMPPRRETQEVAPNAEMAAIIVQQLATVLPNLVIQLSQTINGQSSRNHHESPCNFKQFNSCHPTKFAGNEGATGLLQWTESMENTFRHSQCTNERKVEFATSVFQKRALTWWNGIMRDRGADVAMALTWEELKALMLKEFCPRNEMRALEEEFHDLIQDSGENRAYINRFEELCILCSSTTLLPPDRLIEKFIGGLPTCIKHIVTGSKPATLREAIELSAILTDAHVKEGNLTRKGKTPSKDSTDKAKVDDTGSKSSKNSRNSNKRKAVKNFAVTTPAPANQAVPPPAKRSYVGDAPLCTRCNYHHLTRFPCRQCTSCGRLGHLAATCRVPPPVAAQPRYPIGTCFNCGDPNHFQHECPKLANSQPARGRAFNLNVNEARARTM